MIMQDFTGVPCVVDLATMREAVAELGGDAAQINPLAPAELVIDHSSLRTSSGPTRRWISMSRWNTNAMRSATSSLRWGQSAFDEFKVVRPEPDRPPGQYRIARPCGHDSQWSGVRTPALYWLSHDDGEWTRRLGLGCRWHRAEAAMLGQPVSMLIPRVVGFKLSGELPSGATATDLVLTITELLRDMALLASSSSSMAKAFPASRWQIARRSAT